MIKRLDIYLFRQIVMAFLFSGLAVAIVVLFALSFKMLSFVIDNSGTMLIFFQLMGLMVFTFLPLIMPLSIGVAVVFTYYKLAIDSELIVMRSAGISPLNLARPAIAFSIIVVIVGYMLTTWITPWANRELVLLQYKVRDNFSIFLVKAGAFNDLSDGLTFFARDRKGSDIEGILIHDVRTPEQPVTIMAENGQFTTNEAGEPQIMVFKGKRQEINRATGRLSQLDFDRYVLDLQVLKNGSVERVPDPREQPTSNLFSKAFETTPTSTTATSGRNSKERSVSELHQRLTTPLLALSFCLMGITSILAGPFNRRGMAKRIVIAASAIIILQTASLSLVSMSTKNEWMFIALYAVIITPIPVCAAILGLDKWFHLPFLLHKQHRDKTA
ncbi:MAG: LptF/LptG family permease [Alphaproteobacteria bacterium]|nr:LptF/LptG family permease [Alphaproteobacteria bacterium]